MATVINTFPDRRAELLGKGIGALVGNVIAARQKKKEEEERQKKVNEGIELMGRAARKEKAFFGPSITTGPTRKFREAGPGKGEVTARELQPKPGRVPTGADIAKKFGEAGVDDEFVIALAQGVEEEKAKAERESQQKLNLAAVLSVGGEDLTKAQMFDVIARAGLSAGGLPFEVTRTLINQIDSLAKVEGGDDLRDIPIFNADGPLGNLPVPERVHRLSQPAQDAWFKERGFEGFTTQPTARVPEGKLKASALKRLVDTGVIDQTQADKHAIGAIEVRGPDATGRVSITDTTTNKVTFRGGGDLTPATLSLIDRRVLAINDALLLLKRSDLSSVGIDQILKAEIGGIALQIPVIGSIAEALGLNPEEVNEIQADRSVFFSLLRPLAASFAVGGSRQNQGTKVQIELAKRMSNMVRFSSTPGGAEMSRIQLTEILTEIKNNLVAQRISRSSTPPNVTRVDWFFDENDEIQFKVLE
ncbi:hypothetical protein LCGC14_1185590 [marine sediment metagenome]|uniref:Uncharacterized protein n=1 Tax=marine sediment metagenome TaxID=412755 RepID=A0A0F9P3R2_9ZZZZ